MENNNFKLTTADNNAVNLYDSNFLNGKGAKLYGEERYKEAVEYYRLAAAMGNVHSISNLGYCYLYGRDIEANTSLAIAYFKVAALRKDVYAAYKLGDIYSSDKWGVKDTEMSVYFYRMAMSYVLDGQWDNDADAIRWCDSLEMYPSLCFAMGRELSIGGSMCTDLEAAYQFLLKAKAGYERELMNGSKMYQECYDKVLKLLDDAQFDIVRDMEDMDDEDDDTIHF